MRALLIALTAMLLLRALENTGQKDLSAKTIEHRLGSVLSEVEGAGDVNVLVNEDQEGGIIGVCVLTTNAEDLKVVFRLRSAVCTVLGIENEKVEVLSMEAKK